MKEIMKRINTLEEKLKNDSRLTSLNEEWVSQWLLEDKIAVELIKEQYRLCIAKGYSVYGNPSKLASEIENDQIVLSITIQIEEHKRNYYDRYLAKKVRID